MKSFESLGAQPAYDDDGGDDPGVLPHGSGGRAGSAPGPAGSR